MPRKLNAIARISRFPRAAPWSIAFALCGLALLPAIGRSASSANDLHTSNHDWNGLSKLVQEAGAVGVRLVQVDMLDLERADSRDGLLMIHPTQPLPKRALAAFMRRGGRVALLDDLGSGQDLLSVFNVRRSQRDPAIATPHLRNLRELVIATPVGEHPLASGVEALVTNHPQVLHHPQLDPVFALGDASQALALSGAVGDGRLVAVGDSSVLINNMLEFPDNRRFARNLMRYLAGEHHGQVLLVSDDARLNDETDLRHAGNPVAFVRAALHQMAEHPPNATAVRIATWAVAFGLLLAAITALPQRAAYEHLRGQAAGQPDPRLSRLSYAEAVLRYEQELRSALELALRLPSGATRKALVDAIGASTHDARLARRAQRLLDTLEFHRLRPLTAASIHVSARRFRKLVAEGERIVEALTVVAA